MKKVVIVALIGIAAWQAKLHWGDLFERTPSHVAVVRNASKRVMARVRLTVDGRTIVRERIDAGGEAEIPFKVARDASFEMLWDWTHRDGEVRWKGGFVAAGPLVQRHVLVVHGDGSVIYLPEALPAR